MKKNTQILNDRLQTITEIKRLSSQYASDIKNLSTLNLFDFFNFLKLLPYKRDKVHFEIVARPSIIYNFQFADCKKKSILALSYAKNKNIKTRLVTMSSRSDKKIHHVFPQFLLNNKWVNYDATYSWYKIGEPKLCTNFIIY